MLSIPNYYFTNMPTYVTYHMIIKQTYAYNYELTIESNNNQSITIYSSCRVPLPVDSHHRICQACRERVAESRRRRRPEDQQEAGVTTRPRERPRTVESSNAESRPRGRPRAEPAACISQLSRLCPLALGRMDKECPHCHALHWIDERQETLSLSNPSWESYRKRGSVQLQLLPGPPQYLKDLLASTDTQGRYFKDNLRQYNAAFAFTSLGCSIVSAEDRANNNSNNSNNRVEGSELSYAQLYIFDPSYAAERRQARNSNFDPEIIRELSDMLAQCNLFARVYRYAHEVLSNHGSSNAVSYGNDQREDSAPYIIISPSMRVRLIEGSDRRTHNLPTMEEIVAATPVEYSDRGFRNVVRTLRDNNKSSSNNVFEQYFQRVSQTHDAYMCTNCVLISHHGTYERH
ncbi:hypothetical protein G6F70_003091 [Rhizopus microsporus]|nr:hypothetical protein G6F71_003145 [Rhizopus microsporus]KAG1201503.1 hypothetical protein G6F70_003091 [Rhizopus microsporus]KAG1213466.1 hypothetical protein G6F69_002790 [Rhizopus microsporus]KAG1235458.1 hypothetical protein G6F67_002746 [Rhizopus microsporus]KAG1267504.1 hypothetical protein G6F68_001880 [Rhizopus microsporus]